MRTILSNQYFTGHRVVLNRIVLYYGSSKKYGHTIGYTAKEAREGEDVQSNLTPEEVEILASKVPVDDGDDMVDSGETIIVDVE